jgi:hypothetical protein
MEDQELGGVAMKTDFDTWKMEAVAKHFKEGKALEKGKQLRTSTEKARSNAIVDEKKEKSENEEKMQEAEKRRDDVNNDPINKEGNVRREGTAEQLNSEEKDEGDAGEKAGEAEAPDPAAGGPSQPPWSRRGVPVLPCQGWATERALPPEPGLGNNVVSVVLIAERRWFFTKMQGRTSFGGAMWAWAWSRLVSAASEAGTVKYMSHSTVGNQVLGKVCASVALTCSHQVRMDFVLGGEEQAQAFCGEARRLRSELPRPFVRPFVFLLSERDFGYCCQPVLEEEDLLSLTGQCQHLFRRVAAFGPSGNSSCFHRHAIRCNVKLVEGKITCRFSNLSDVNLFLHNKVDTVSTVESNLVTAASQEKHASKRNLGQLRAGVVQRELVPDSQGLFKLFSIESGAIQLLTVFKVIFTPALEFEFPLEEMAGRFHFEVRNANEHGMDGKYFCFNSKLDMFLFFASEESKGIDHLRIADNHIIDMEVKSVYDKQLAKTIENKPRKSPEISNEDRIFQRKIEAQDRRILEQDETIKLLSEEIRSLRGGERPPPGPGLGLEQLLTMEFRGETVRSPLPLHLVAFLRGGAAHSTLEERADGRLVLRYRDRAALAGDLQCLTERSRAGLAATAGASQRAAILPDPDSGDYEAEVLLEEAGLLRTSIPEVELALKAVAGSVTLSPRGFHARFPSLASLLRALRGQDSPLRHHTVRIARRNLHYYSHRRTCYDGFPCLTEPELLSLADLAATKSGGGAATGLTLVLGHAAIQDMTADWAGQLVAVLGDAAGLKALLAEWATSRAALARRPPLSRLRPQAGGLYCLEWPGGRLDPRDFMRHDELCISLGPGGGVASRSKAFLGRALLDIRLRAAYPGLTVAGRNLAPA